MLPKNFPSTKIFSIITPFILITLLYSFNLLYQPSKRPPLYVSKQKETINFDINFLRFSSFGQYRLLSSLIWIETLLFSDLEKYKKMDLKSWMYLRLKSIVSLDPFFYDAYVWGGIYLAIIKDDLVGAADIYELGLKHFPEDYRLNFYAAFNYYHQLNNKRRAIELLEKIKHNPQGSPFIHRLIARLKADTGEMETAFVILETAYRTTPQGPLKKRLFENLYSIKAEIDLTCLNGQQGRKKECPFQDLEGRPYIYSQGKYKAQKEWRPYRTHRRSMASEKKAKKRGE